MPFRRIFPFIPEKKGLYIIRGPRQIGKSSWLKSILSYHAQRDPKSCFYLSCENIRTHMELAQTLNLIRGKSVVLLDEISFVEDWSRAIKHELDRGEFKILVITGSNSMDLRKGADRLPGRFAAGGEFMLLPMAFDEFCQMRIDAKWKPLSRDELLSQYFKIGGFPTALAEAGEEGHTPVQSKETYRRWLVGDFVRCGKQELYLREMMGQLALTITSPISLQKIAAKTQMGSHHTASEYIAALEDCFALRTLYAIDPNSGALRFRKEKKFYFSDPLLYWIALEWCQIPHPIDSEAKLAELVAHETLYRRYPRIGYYHSQKGEIDFYVKDEWALEVKWAADLRNLSKAYREIALPQKMVWVKSNFLQEFPNNLRIPSKNDF